MNRDGSSREDAASRLNSQFPIGEKINYADHVIENSGSLQELEEQVNLLLAKVEKEVGWFWWRVNWLIPPIGLLSALSALIWRALWRSRKTSYSRRRAS